MSMDDALANEEGNLSRNDGGFIQRFAGLLGRYLPAQNCSYQRLRGA